MSKLVLFGTGRGADGSANYSHVSDAKLDTLVVDAGIGAPSHAAQAMEMGFDAVLLTSPSIVYETGAFTDPKWKDAQNLPHDWYVQIQAIESFGIMK